MIDGIGGIGKTALAVEISYICLEQGLFEAFLYQIALKSKVAKFRKSLLSKP